jgi:putative ABC transport system ATP-binding protein
MIELRNVKFRYPGAGAFQLQVPDLRVNQGECVAIVGPSGSGKTTLLSLLSGIVTPESGSIMVDETDLARLNDSQRRQFRIRNIGQVFQTFELLKYLTVAENVALPNRVEKTCGNKDELRQHVARLLQEVGLELKSGAYPEQLSQGEQQRIAVCRAMFNRPRLLLADEPTGNLDQANKQNVVDLLINQARDSGSTLLMVTHDRSLLSSFSRVLDMPSVIGSQHRGEELS